MKWADLSKEQKQYVALGGIVAIALLYVIYTLLTGLSSPGEEEEEVAEINLSELEAQVDKAENCIRKERRMVSEYNKNLDELKALQEEYFPNEDNRYSWVTELIYTQCRRYGIEVKQINEVGRSDSDELYFNRYAVQVILLCSYDKLIDFTRYFEKSNPLMRIFEVSVTTDPKDLENHNIKLIMAWPTSMDIKKIEE